MSDRTKRTTQEELPEEILWTADGHASDVVLTSIADGQTAIVPGAARAHVERCVACSRHLGNAALLSIYAERQIAAMAEHSRTEALVRTRVPRLPIALGLVVSAAGLVPTLLDRDAFARTTSFLTVDAPLFARALDTGLKRLFEPGSPSALALTYGTATFLVLVGLAVVRLLPKKETSR